MAVDARFFGVAVADVAGVTRSVCNLDGHSD